MKKALRLTESRRHIAALAAVRKCCALADGLVQGDGVRPRDHGFGTVAKSAVPVIAFHWPVSEVGATAPLASTGWTSNFIEP